MRLQLQLLQQLRQPAPAVGGSKATGVPASRRPRSEVSSAESLARLRLRSWPPCSSTNATWERLRWTSMPTYTLMRASFPELV